MWPWSADDSPSRFIARGLEYCCRSGDAGTGLLQEKLVCYKSGWLLRNRLVVLAKSSTLGKG